MKLICRLFGHLHYDGVEWSRYCLRGDEPADNSEPMERIAPGP